MKRLIKKTIRMTKKNSIVKLTSRNDMNNSAGSEMLTINFLISPMELLEMNFLIFKKYPTPNKMKTGMILGIISI
jgi:hypothetical protein